MEQLSYSIKQLFLVWVNGADNYPYASPSTEGRINMWITNYCSYLHQLFGLDGTIGIYHIDGQSQEEIGRESGNLPDTNTQGIVAI